MANPMNFWRDGRGGRRQGVRNFDLADAALVDAIHSFLMLFVFTSAPLAKPITDDRRPRQMTKAEMKSQILAWKAERFHIHVSRLKL